MIFPFKSSMIIDDFPSYKHTGTYIYWRIPHIFPMVFHGFSMILQLKKKIIFFFFGISMNFPYFPVVFHWFSHSKTSIDSSMRFFPTQDGPLGWKPWSCRAFRPRRRQIDRQYPKKRVVNDGKLTFIFFSEGLKSPTSISYSISYYISCPISCSINITNDG